MKQADAAQNRNILLVEAKARQIESKQFNVATFLAQRSELPIRSANSFDVNLDTPATGIVHWSENEIELLLDQFNLARATGLSVLAVEMMPRYDQYIYHGPPVDDTIRPLSAELGQYRILRTSRLIAAPEICSPEPAV